MEMSTIVKEVAKTAITGPDQEIKMALWIAAKNDIIEEPDQWNITNYNKEKEEFTIGNALGKIMFDTNYYETYKNYKKYMEETK